MTTYSNTKHSNSPTGINAGSTGIRDQLRLACTTLLDDLAGNANTDIAAAYSAWLAAGNDPSTFDTTKLFLDTGRGIAVDARQYSNTGVEIISNDILIAQNNIIATQGDMLVGGLGNVF